MQQVVSTMAYMLDVLVSSPGSRVWPVPAEPSAGPSSSSEDSKENLAEMGPATAPDSFFNLGF